MKRSKILSVAVVFFMLFALLFPLSNSSVKAASDDGLIISEYVEGSGNNKALELYNGTGHQIDLGDYILRLYSNGHTSANSTLYLSGTLDPGKTFVIVNGNADQSLKDKANSINSGVTSFNGDDAISLDRRMDDSHVDVFGTIGQDPGSYWGSGSCRTKDHTLVRKACVTKGNPDGFTDPSVEWDCYPQDDFSHIGWHIMVTSTVPKKDATNVDVTTVVSVTFGESMDASTITESTFILKDSSGNAVSGTVSYDDTTKTATLTPSSNLSDNTTYTATISGYVKDANGHAMGKDCSWSFTTGEQQEVAPSVQTDSATNVTKTTATLNGELTDMGSASQVTVYFEYGTDTSYGNETPHQTLSATGSFSADITGLTPGTTYHFRAVAVNSAGTSYGEDKTFGTYEATTPVVLFDDTKDETAGNADWVIDGAYSDWADALRNEGYIVESLDSGSITSDALNGVNVFVIPEPQDEFTSEEITAIKTFVNNGGGLVLIADHSGSDRNNNGHDSPHIYDNNFGVSDFGFTFNLDQFSEDPISNVNHTIYPELTDGVSQIGIWAGSSISITDSQKAKGVIFTNDGSKIVVVGAEVGNGRVAAIGDSSPFDDGSGHPGNHLYDGWNEYDDSKLGIDMVKWCADALLAPPTVQSVSPENGATDVNVNTTITATFSKPMDASTITTSTFTVKYSTGNAVSGAVSYNNTTRTAMFTPSSPLDFGKTYTATISGTVKDVAGNAMGSDYSWSFTTMSLNPPSAPQNLTASADNANESIALSWSASTPGTYPIAGYAIYRGTSAGGENSTPIATVGATTTSYTDTNLAPGTYYYYVKAFDNQNPPDYSLASNEASATIEMEVTPIGTARTMQGQTVLIKGTATVPSGTFSSKYFYLQDSTGGIEVYCSSGVGTINLNDVYEVEGEISVYHDTVEIKVSSPDDITRVGSGTPVAPKEIEISDISAYYGELVKIQGTVSSKYSSSFYVEDSEGNSVKIYIKGATGINTSDIGRGDTVSVTGIAEIYRGHSEVMPRFQTDIVKFVMPTVITLPPSHITQTTATLNGSLTDMGTATSVTVYFEYGTGAGYGHTTPQQTLTSTGTFSANLSFLKPNTTYHFRAVAVSLAGTSYGQDRTFKTPKVKQVDTTPPTVSIPDVDTNFQTVTNSSTFSFTLIATDNSGMISRTVIKDNGIKVKDVYGLPEGSDPTITLFEGENNIEVTVYDFYGNYTSKKFTVISDTKPPIVELTTPIPHSVSSSTLTVKGNAYDKVTGIKFFKINGKNISVSADNSFKVSISLKAGVNKITIEAADKAGNIFKKAYSVVFVKPGKNNNLNNKIITLQIGNPFITINGTKRKIDAQNSKPIIKNNRTLIPIRSLIEALGGTISWNGKTREVTIQLNGNTIILTIDKSTALVNGIKTPIDPKNSKVTPIIVNNRTYLPLRFIVEHLGCTVDWNPATKTITVYFFG